MDLTEGNPSLPWLWIIEYLACSERVNLQLLYGVIQSASVLRDELGKNVRELISLRCLEQLCGPANVNETTCDVPPDLDSGPMFELSRSCEDVLEGILQEGSVSDFRMTGRELLKSQVRQFIMQKRNSMPKPALQQLKDAILRGTHPDAASLKVLSGLACLTADNRVSVDNVGHSDTSLCAPDRRRDNDLNMGPNGNPNSAEHDLLERQLEGDLRTRTSPPLKRNLTVLDHENLALNSPGNQHIDDDFAVHSPIPKKLKQFVLDANQPEKSDSVVIELDSESGVDAKDKFDLAQGQMETADEHRTIEECAETYGEQGGISDRLPDRNEDGVAVPESMAKGDPDTSQKPTDGLSAGEFQQRETTDEDVGLMDQQQVEELSSDSDGYLIDDINDSMKDEFLVSHCTSTGDSLGSFERMEQNICMKCNEGGQLLVCHTSRCRLMVHENCVDSSTSFAENGNFFCHFCQYSNAILEYLQAKREATSARKDLPAFICTIFEHHPKNLNGMHHDYSRIDIDEHAEVSEDHYCSQEEGQYQEQGGQDSCVNKVNDRQMQGEEGAKEWEEPKLNGDTWDEVSDHQLQSDGVSEGQADGSERNSDLNARSPTEEEEVSNGDAAARGAEDNEENEKNMQQSNLPSREFELDTFGRPTLGTKEKQVKGKTRECQSRGRFEGPEGEVISDDHTTRTLDGKSDEVGDQQRASPNDINEPLCRPGCALHVDGEDDSEDDIEDSDADDESMISNYSISFRRRTNRRVSTSPVVPCRRPRKAPWTEEEVKILKEGVEKFLNTGDKSIAWKKILEFGAAVLMHGRTAQDLKNKWSSISRRSPKLK